jgi:hypothetical protein
MNKFSVILQEKDEAEPSKATLTFFCPTCNKRMDISNACCHNIHTINSNSHDLFKNMFSVDHYTLADEARELSEEHKRLKIKARIGAYFQVNKNGNLFTGEHNE